MGLFDWFNSEEDDRIVGEISNDNGDHVVFDVPAEEEGTVRRIMRENKIEYDRDERLIGEFGGKQQIESRDPDKHRYHMQPVVSPHEDLEPEEDDDSITENDEQAASGGWFSWW